MDLPLLSKKLILGMARFETLYAEYSYCQQSPPSFLSLNRTMYFLNAKDAVPLFKFPPRHTIT